MTCSACLVKRSLRLGRWLQFVIAVSYLVLFVGLGKLIFLATVLVATAMIIYMTWGGIKLPAHCKCETSLHTSEPPRETYR